MDAYVVQLITETDIHDFYRRWSRRVFAFCRLFLGNHLHAEEATRAAFLAYVERDLALDFGKMPDDLLRFAWEASKPYGESRPSPTASPQNLAEAILRLPVEDRAVFILTCVMAFAELDAGTVLEWPVQKVRETRTRSLLGLRQLLPASFFRDR